MIKAISHLGLAVKDLQEARTFYRNVFGIDSSEPIVGGGGTVRVSMVELKNNDLIWKYPRYNMKF